MILRILNLLVITALIAALTSPVMSDTLFLKNGKVIQSDNIWKDDGYYMYTLYGATVGIYEGLVERVELKTKYKKTDTSFQFDIWQLGYTLQEVIDIAERNDIPLHKSGVISSNKRFHPMVRKHIDANHFYYNTTLLGHFAKVELFFTPESKHLHTVKIHWPSQIKKDSVLVQKIASMITEKYGKPYKGGRKLFYDNTSWVTADANQIQMNVHSTSINLGYLHSELLKLNKQEIHELKVKRVQAGATKDKSKF